MVPGEGFSVRQPAGTNRCASLRQRSRPGHRAPKLDKPNEGFMLPLPVDLHTDCMRPRARPSCFMRLRWLLVLVVAFALSVQAENTQDPKKLVADAWTTLGRFLDDPEQSQFREILPQAKAILIIPNLVRAGFIVGGAGGAGLLLSREPKHAGWSQPAFLNLSGASLGLQAGAEVSEVIYLVMTPKGLDALMSTKVKLGGSIGVAAGAVGAGKGGTLDADLLSFARGKGLYAGVVGKGMVVEPDGQAVKSYYGRDATPEDILFKKKVYNRDASKLVSLVAKAARPARKK